MRVRDRAIQREVVLDFAFIHEFRDAAEAVNWVLLIIVIGFEDATDHVDGGFVLVARAHEVQTVLICSNAIRSGVVDRDCEIDLPATPQVVNESRYLRLRRFISRLRVLLLFDGDSPHNDASLM